MLNFNAINRLNATLKNIKLVTPLPILTLNPNTNTERVNSRNIKNCYDNDL